MWHIWDDNIDGWKLVGGPIKVAIYLFFVYWTLLKHLTVVIILFSSLFDYEALFDKGGTLLTQIYRYSICRRYKKLSFKKTKKNLQINRNINNMYKYEQHVLLMSDKRNSSWTDGVRRPSGGEIKTFWFLFSFLCWHWLFNQGI